jgi:hypothetical protein|tara:strand:+ start:929 stop:1168 length:240 start_codon:yes stop_codon:yes gene_type:complete
MNDDESHQQHLERQRQEFADIKSGRFQKKPLNIEITERLRQAEAILHPLTKSKEGVYRYWMFCRNMLSILRQKQSQQNK